MGKNNKDNINVVIGKHMSELTLKGQKIIYLDAVIIDKQNIYIRFK